MTTKMKLRSFPQKKKQNRETRNYGKSILSSKLRHPLEIMDTQEFLKRGKPKDIWFAFALVNSF